MRRGSDVCKTTLARTCGVTNVLVEKFVLVGEKRLELLCIAAHAPKACVYTNSTTRPEKHVDGTENF